MGSPVEVREAVCEGESAGRGLFLNRKEGVLAGTLLTRYPGQPRWFKTKRDGDIRQSNKYTILMGVFTVVDESGKRLVSRALGWDVPENYVALDHKLLGHFVNSSIPRSLEVGYRTPNAVWGFRIIEMELDCRVEPQIQLWLISARHIPENVQVLVDYHWVFSYGGQWCMDSNCDSCKQGLKAFVRSL